MATGHRDLEAAIQTAIQQRLAKMVEDETEAAIARVRAAISGVTAEIVLTLSRYYDLERMGDRLVITVREPKP